MNAAEPEPHNRFDAAAGAYDRARPPYPRELVDWLAGAAGLGAGAGVLDLGAGTGELTSVLANAGMAVVAAEPSERMRRVLASRLPRIEVVAERAEDLSFADGRFELVTAANALHWFDPELAYPEIARVLRPGGRLAVVWHLPDRSDALQDRLWRLVEHLHATAAPYPGPDPGGRPEWEPRFERVASTRFNFIHRLPRGSLPDYVASWSGVANLEPAPREVLLDDVRGWSVAETVELPFRIEVVLGRRLPA